MLVLAPMNHFRGDTAVPKAKTSYGVVTKQSKCLLTGSSAGSRSQLKTVAPAHMVVRRGVAAEAFDRAANSFVAA